MRALVFFLLLIQLFGPEVQAEYRVFRLRITKTAPTTVDPKAPPEVLGERFVLSTLDPIQYPRYYPLEPGETVSYTETWRCYGRTDDFKEYCPNPKATPAP